MKYPRTRVMLVACLVGPDGKPGWMASSEHSARHNNRGARSEGRPASLRRREQDGQGGGEQRHTDSRKRTRGT